MLQGIVALPLWNFGSTDCPNQVRTKPLQPFPSYFASQHGCTNVHLPSLLFALHAKKAFNRIHWRSCGYFKHMWIHGPYQIFHSGTLFSSMSPLIFAVMKELLSELVRMAPEIKGTVSGHEEHKIKSYMVILAVTDPLNSFYHVWILPTDFGKIYCNRVNNFWVLYLHLEWTSHLLLGNFINQS